MHRLVSIYRDNLERYDEKFYNEIGIHIVKRYRQRALKRFEHLQDPKIGKEPMFPVGRDDYGNMVELPSFWEFVMVRTQANLQANFYVLKCTSSPCKHIIEHKDDLSGQDELWRPSYKTCQVCQFNFRWIIKYERIQEEQTMLAQNLGYDGKLG